MNMPILWLKLTIEFRAHFYKDDESDSTWLTLFLFISHYEVLFERKLRWLCHGNDYFPKKYLQQIVVDACCCFDIFPITGSKRRLLWHGGKMHIPVCAKSLVLCLVRTNTIWYTFKYTSIRMWYTMPVATQRRKAYQWGSTLQHLFCTQGFFHFEFFFVIFFIICAR